MSTQIPAPLHDPVNNPSHYTSDPSGVECIEITRHMGFNAGNAVKYLWRLGKKGDAIEDARKALFYLEDSRASLDNPGGCIWTDTPPAHRVLEWAFNATPSSLSAGAIKQILQGDIDGAIDTLVQLIGNMEDSRAEGCQQHEEHVHD